jgi:GT2 family glycosyltransferase
MKKKKLLIGSCICQSPRILSKFLYSLYNADLTMFDATIMFVDDNQDEASSEMLRAAAPGFNTKIIINNGPPRDTVYLVNEATHYWSDDLVLRVAGMKNEIIKFAIDEGFDYLFLIDSDLLINAGLIKHLAAQDKDIICEVFWTAWQPDTIELPNAWYYDKYEMAHPSLEKEERARLTYEFITQLKEPGIYEVGGLGACTLISKNALVTGVNFSPISNITVWGEDRWFCIRAAVHGIPLFLDTHYPAKHLYRESEVWL